MDRKNRISESRLTVAIEAGQRWQQRAPERTGEQKLLAIGGPAKADSPQRAAQFELRESHPVRGGFFFPIGGRSRFHAREFEGFVLVIFRIGGADDDRHEGHCE